MLKDEDKNKTYWDKRLNTYDFEDGGYFDRRLFKLQEKKIIELVKEVNPNTILEIGFGTGRVLELINKEFPEIKLYGYDQSPTAYKITKEKVPNAVLYNKSEDYIQAYDLVILCEVLLHNKINDRRKLIIDSLKMGERVLIIDKSQICGFIGNGLTISSYQGYFLL